MSPRLKRRERNSAAESGTMGEKCPGILPKVATFTSLLGSFTCRKFTTWDRRLYFPSEGRRAENFFARKSDGFGRVWMRELGYQRPARLPLEHRSRPECNLHRRIQKTHFSRPYYIIISYCHQVLWSVWKLIIVLQNSANSENCSLEVCLYCPLFSVFLSIFTHI